MTTNLSGTVWSVTRKRDGFSRTTYVRVQEHGPDRALVVRCDERGRVFFTLGRGYDQPYEVQLTHDGTQVKGRKRVETAS